MTIEWKINRLLTIKAQYNLLSCAERETEKGNKLYKEILTLAEELRYVGNKFLNVSEIIH